MESLITTVVIVVVALVIPGVINRTRAILSGRKGVTLYQHLHNVDLLVRKGAVYSPVTTLLFRAVPSVYLGASVVALLFVPVAGMEPLLHFKGDFVVFAYMLALSRAALILAAMDTGSSFEGMGASREALYGAMVEPVLFIVAATLALISGVTSFGDVFSHIGVLSPEMVIVLLLLAYVLVKFITVEMGRIPVDDPRTHLELTMIHEVMILDYSGIDLAMITIGGWLKMGAVAMLAANAVASTVSLGVASSVVLSLVVGVVIGVVESTQARNKLSRNTTYILTIVAIAAVLFMVAYILLQNITLR